MYAKFHGSTSNANGGAACQRQGSGHRTGERERGAEPVRGRRCFLQSPIYQIESVKRFPESQYCHTNCHKLCTFKVALALPMCHFCDLGVMYHHLYFVPSGSLMDSTIAAVSSFISLLFTALEVYYRSAPLWNADAVNCDISLEYSIKTCLTEMFGTLSQCRSQNFHKCLMHFLRCRITLTLSHVSYHCCNRLTQRRRL